MIPNGKQIIIDGHNLTFESEPSDCRGCFFENRDSCPDCDGGMLVEEGSPWHTGVPTEDGDYLVKLDVGNNVYPYYVLKWNKKGWYSHYDMDYPACPQHSVLKWQKIEEASNGSDN